MCPEDRFLGLSFGILMLAHEILIPWDQGFLYCLSYAVLAGVIVELSFLVPGTEYGAIINRVCIAWVALYGIGYAVWATYMPVSVVNWTGIALLTYILSSTIRGRADGRYLACHLDRIGFRSGFAEGVV
jgi:hypothetical protein